MPENDDVRNSLSLNVIQELKINYKNINIDTLDPYLKNNYLKQSIKQHYNNFNQIKKI